MKKIVRLVFEKLPHDRDELWRISVETNDQYKHEINRVVPGDFEPLIDYFFREALHKIKELCKTKPEIEEIS